jgi:electron transfer flavoprotein alpha/beta subunit
MKVLVPVKRVVDANLKVRVKPDKTGIDLANVKWLSIRSAKLLSKAVV